jgi:nicotinamide-nucleotide amidase
MTLDEEMELKRLAERVGAALEHAGVMLATAESCTGGWIAKVVTDVAGSSSRFERGFVTYSNPAKISLLGVEKATLECAGAVSEQTAREMAAGALRHSAAQIAVAVTGIAGPDGGSIDKPVGTVWLAWAWHNGRIEALRRHFSGDRDAVRRQTVVAALEKIVDELA